MMAARHARELANAEIAARLAKLLLENLTDDPDIAWLLAHREIHIIARAKPDGRRQVEQGASLWRKNHNASSAAASPSRRPTRYSTWSNCASRSLARTPGGSNLGVCSRFPGVAG